MKVSMLCMIALTACGSAEDQHRNTPATDAGGMRAASVAKEKATTTEPSGTIQSIPDRYKKAFMCDFAENPIAAWERYHKSPAGRADRGNDLKVLKSLGFDREGHDGDLESLGGKITAPAGLTIFGLPVRFLELNGMIGDANSMYVTTFAKGVAVDQVVRAARLEMDHESYNKYKIRYYGRRIGNDPYTTMYLDDRGSGDAVLTCQIQLTPD